MHAYGAYKQTYLLTYIKTYRYICIHTYSINTALITYMSRSGHDYGTPWLCNIPCDMKMCLNRSNNHLVKPRISFNITPAQSIQINRSINFRSYVSNYLCNVYRSSFFLYMSDAQVSVFFLYKYLHFLFYGL